MGRGGAERLVVDLAVGLHGVSSEIEVIPEVYTARHPSTAFAETRDGRLTVREHGNFLPRGVFGGLAALCATVRNLYTCGALVCRIYLDPEWRNRCDAVIVDQVSTWVPLLRMLLSPLPTQVLFYCHFPDMLLAQRRPSLLYKVYRGAMDTLEDVTTAFAHTVVANSRFTRSVMSQHLRTVWSVHATAEDQRDASRIGADVDADENYHPERCGIGILYPGVPMDDITFQPPYEGDGPPLLLSLNRFERKKRVDLAVRAVAQAREGGSKAVLALVGALDRTLPSQVEYFEEVLELARTAFGESNVVVYAQDDEQTSALASDAEWPVVSLWLNVSHEVKLALLQRSLCVLYTPPREHFGIVPVEAQATGRPVVAFRSGGPRESVQHGITGMLAPCDPSQDADTLDKQAEQAFADATCELVSKLATERDTAGKLARERAETLFGREAMAQQLQRLIYSERRVRRLRRRSRVMRFVLLMTVSLVTLLIGHVVTSVASGHSDTSGIIEQCPYLKHDNNHNENTVAANSEKIRHFADLSFDNDVVRNAVQRMQKVAVSGGTFDTTPTDKHNVHLRTLLDQQRLFDYALDPSLFYSTKVSHLLEGENRITREEMRNLRNAFLSQPKGEENWTQRPLLVVVAGHVFDVGAAGAAYYDPRREGSAGYSVFTFQDVSLSFVTGEFENKEDEEHEQDMTCAQVVSILDWLKFYHTHGSYSFVGVLAPSGDSDAFHSATGLSSKWQHTLRTCAQEWQRQVEHAQSQEGLEQRFPPCNVRVTQRAHLVWCTPSSGGIKREWAGVPRRIAFDSADKTEGKHRCGCVDDRSSAELMHTAVAVYEECAHLSVHNPRCWLKGTEALMREDTGGAF